MKAIFYLKILVIISLLGACSNNGDSEFEVIEANILSISCPESSLSGESVAIEVMFQGRNGCSTPFDIKGSKVGQTITLRAYYKHPTDNRPCTEILPTFKLDYTFFSDLPGVYFFQSEQNRAIADTLTVY